MTNDKKQSRQLDMLWSQHHAEWRDPMEVTTLWQAADAQDARLFKAQVTGDWWDILAEAGLTLLVTREYEHLVMALSSFDGAPYISYYRLPHPSGMAFDKQSNTLHIAATRNPNQIFSLRPVQSLLERQDMPYDEPLKTAPLVPSLSRFYAGSLYIHDLAIINQKLYANAVGHNSIVRLDDDGTYERVWYPRCIEVDGKPVFGQNHIQLNSIAAGDSLENSYFSASSDKLTARRPGHRNYPVDKQGVIFSGKTRDVIARGLTRPHSARLYQGKIWVDNSGYGELLVVEAEKPTVVTKLPGWTRGLAFHENIAFVGTSRVIPRFSQYAPGLDVQKSVCGIHAVDLSTGDIKASISWSYGNQIFAIELLPAIVSHGFPFIAQSKRASEREKRLFYTFRN